MVTVTLSSYLIAQVSVDLMQQLISDINSPEWISWLAHIAMLEKVLATSFSKYDIFQMDKAIEYHSRCFHAVWRYRDLLKPKHHFLFHIPIDTLQNGPPRFNWCFHYEAKNQEIKRASLLSNFKDVCGTVIRYLAMQSAQQRLRGHQLDEHAIRELPMD